MSILALSCASPQPALEVNATSATGVDDAGTPNLLQTLDGIISITDGIATADKMIRGMQDYIKEQCLK
jgi:prophage endopeptidase